MNRQGLLGIGVLLLTVPLAAATIHVPADQPTIQDGINVAAAGDTVLVASGRYTETIMLEPDVDVLGSGPGTTMIIGTDPDVAVFGADQARLAGFWITGSFTAIHLENNAGMATSPIIEDNVIECAHGITCWVPYQQGPNSPVIRRNIIVSSEKGIYLFEQAYANGGANAIIENNTIHGARVGIQYRSHMALPFVTGNIIAGCDFGIQFTYCDLFEERVALIACNDVWNNQEDYWLEDLSCGPFDLVGIQGNFRSDPLFCDAINGNFGLCADSPCAAVNNPDCGQIGAGPIDCGPCGSTPTAATTWGALKNSFR